MGNFPQVRINNSSNNKRTELYLKKFLHTKLIAMTRALAFGFVVAACIHFLKCRSSHVPRLLSFLPSSHLHFVEKAKLICWNFPLLGPLLKTFYLVCTAHNPRWSISLYLDLTDRWLTSFPPFPSSSFMSKYRF